MGVGEGLHDYSGGSNEVMNRVQERSASRQSKNHLKVVSLLDWLAARAQQGGEPVGPILRQAVLAVIS